MKHIMVLAIVLFVSAADAAEARAPTHNFHPDQLHMSRLSECIISATYTFQKSYTTFELRTIGTYGKGIPVSTKRSPERVSRIKDLRRPENLQRRVLLTIRVVERTEIMPVEYEGQLQNALPFCVVEDRQKDEIKLLGVVGNESVDLIWDSFRRCRELDLEVEVVIHEETYALKFIHAVPIESCVQLIGAGTEEVREAKTLVESLRRPGDLIDYMVTEAVNILGIQNIEQNPILRRALVAAILQSVGHGRLQDSPATINILLVGPPGTGKRVVHRASALFAAISQSISSNTLTPAGLVGTAERIGRNISRVMPGKLPLAHWGVAKIEDLQHIDLHSRRHAYGNFCDLMERGWLGRTTHREVELQVEAALLCDVNPKSTVRPAHSAQDVLYLDDLDLPIPFLSRLDVVIVFPRDADKQIALMKSIIGAATTVGPETDLERDPRVRALQVAVAYLRDHCATVNVEPVTEAVNAKVDELIQANIEKLSALNLAADFMLRSAKSILKLVAASARLHNRCTAEQIDVDVAFEIFSEKMMFLAKIEPCFKAVDTWKYGNDHNALRQHRIIEHLGGKTVATKDVQNLFRDISSRQITRDLNEIGAQKSKKGHWDIPSAL